MQIITLYEIVLAVGALLLPAIATAQAQAPKEQIARGQYIFAISGGCACHTEPKGVHNVGARAFPIPLGTVYSTNITPDKETGLGDWTDQQFMDAMTKGLRKDGSRLLPVMPYTLYSGMAQEDLRALLSYLRSLKPVRKPTPELKTSTPFARSVATAAWLKAFGTFYESPAQAPKAGIARGKYLTDHVAICGDCHTPRNSLGVPSRTLYMAGSPKDGPIGELVPNITPDKETGIGDWKREDIAELLIKGIKPDFDNVQGLMLEVIQGAPHGYKDMTREDALAIADYLKSIPAIKNKPK
ncbi:MAG: cytochrome C [Deltaproteobacteria bacterium]|nr:cytochrome C [Deltaproteobacteria bacterium]MBM4297818.1 cytochrome C [Deltaproteobacteria bacterium]